MQPAFMTRKGKGLKSDTRCTRHDIRVEVALQPASQALYFKETGQNGP